MSEVQTCENCHFQAYASDGAVSQRTIEYEADDGTILAADRTLCDGCTSKFRGRWPPFCPFCLERVHDDHDPAECSERAEAGA